ncbi:MULTISPECIES: hypothetical protein [Methylomonas]|uniref:Uncharacterized protein n=2 Tax=Methylomonas TaxID=416 RepID=A0A140E5G4_9GAMM|nr:MULTISPECIES: hypothetical protein [Methylomonas]AMK75638.1 hypothetical protein JT25_003905 [Methylomonas denitrificans]OAH96153.1 hypothetical protein A1342_06715 [Methylomonas methanica]TCV75248.1 hypothetical protein EDE11_1359 [Methylomonas methanica]
MATEAEKDNLINSITTGIDACDRKARNQDFPDEWRKVFALAAFQLTDCSGKLRRRSAEQMDSYAIQAAVEETDQATTATNDAHDEISVKNAGFELSQAIHALMQI